MRKWICVPMMTLCLLLAGCGGGAEKTADSAREPFRTMTGCTAEAKVTCGASSDTLLTFTLRCTFVPDGTSTVEVLAPESVAGIKASVSGKSLKLVYEDLCLDAGSTGNGELSPAVCLPRIFSALRNGWLLEENEEKLNDVPCVRLSLDETGESGEKILTTVWLACDGGAPVYAELSAEEEIILTAEFTDFRFGDILNQQGEESGDTESAQTAPQQ